MFPTFIFSLPVSITIDVIYFVLQCYNIFKAAFFLLHLIFPRVLTNKELQVLIIFIGDNLGKFAKKLLVNGIR